MRQKPDETEECGYCVASWGYEATPPGAQQPSLSVPAAVGVQWLLERRKAQEPRCMAEGRRPERLTGAFHLRKPSSRKYCFLLNVLCKIPQLFCLD